MSALPAFTCAHQDVRTLRTGLTAGCELPCGYWEPNPGNAQNHWAISTFFLSHLQVPQFHFLMQVLFFLLWFVWYLSSNKLYNFLKLIPSLELINFNSHALSCIMTYTVVVWIQLDFQTEPDHVIPVWGSNNWSTGNSDVYVVICEWDLHIS